MFPAHFRIGLSALSDFEHAGILEHERPQASERSWSPLSAA
jgi:hypothetical protein